MTGLEMIVKFYEELGWKAQPTKFIMVGLLTPPYL